jgi:RF-1 domain
VVNSLVLMEAVGVILVEGVHPAAVDEEALLKACEVARGRGSGPGGQHRNKVETKVVLVHRPTGVSGQASERRSAAENKRVALFRLRLALACEVRAPVKAGEVGSAMWRERTRGGKIACNPEHRDFPAMLAEALDVIEACGLDPKKAGVRLGVTPSQLIKLVKEWPPAFEAWNARRVERGMHRLG